MGLSAQAEETAKRDYGFNVMSMEFGSMFDFGIIDPAKVVRAEVQNAASVAMMAITMGALISDLPEKKNEEGLP